MGRYVIRRLLHMIPVFLGTTFLIFVMVHVLGDPATALFGDRTPDPATAARLRAEFHLDQPLWQQYLLYLGNIFSGDFGTAFNGQPVTELMAHAFPVSLRLVLVAMGFVLVLGITLGVVTGLRSGGRVDSSVLRLGLVVIAVPAFVTGVIAQFVFGVTLGWAAPAVSQAAPLVELLLPGLILALVPLAYVTRRTRTAVAENVRADHLRTAVAGGLPTRRTTTHHLLRGSLLPVVACLGSDVGNLMAGALVTERIFGIPGAGFQLWQGVLRQNAPTVVGFVTVLVLISLLANLLADLLHAALDPRVRHV